MNGKDLDSHVFLHTMKQQQSDTNQKNQSGTMIQITEAPHMHKI